MMERCVICRQRELRSRVFEGMCASCLFDELKRVRKERNEFKARLDGMKLNAQATAESTAQKALEEGQTFPRGRW